jgi:sialate O-acetylesterase
MKTISFLMFLLIAWTTAGARVVLPPVLASHMVLQQQSSVKLWGEASPNQAVTIKPSWSSTATKVRTSKSGFWEATIQTPTAGGPYQISISDGEELVLDQILIGEVWFCSGQSNMEMPLMGFDGSPVEGSQREISQADPSLPVKVFLADVKEGRWTKYESKKLEKQCEGTWCPLTPETLAQTSAVAYFFAKHLYASLRVPVGVIVASHGGSWIETWMDRPTLAAFPEIDTSALDNDDPISDPYRTPSILYNAKLYPFFRTAVKGMIWYQGESNSEQPEKYSRLLPAFIRMVRQQWQPEMPFYYVEVAPYHYDWDGLLTGARLREHQFKGKEGLPHCGMVSTLDLGDFYNVHPSRKEPIGFRLAQWALGDCYGIKGLTYASPSFRSMEVKEGKALIKVNDAPLGLYPMWVKLEGFEVAGADRKFYPAEAVIQGNNAYQIEVHSPQVAQPVAVRYAYQNCPKATVFNTAGLPLIPFRTDNW